MWQPLVHFPSFYSSAFPRTSYEWNHTEQSPLCLASFSSQTTFEMYSCRRIQQWFVPLILFIGHVYHRLCDCSSAPLLKKIWVVPSTKLWCLKHPCTGLCVNINFHFSRVIWQVHAELHKKLASCFPEWLYHLHSRHQWREVLDAQCSGWHLVLSTEWTSQDADMVMWEWFDVFLLLLGWRSLRVLGDLAWPCCLLSGFLWVHTPHSRLPALPLASNSRCFLLPGALRLESFALIFAGWTPSQPSHLSSNAPPQLNFLTPQPMCGWPGGLSHSRLWVFYHSTYHSLETQIYFCDR